MPGSRAVYDRPKGKGDPGGNLIFLPLELEMGTNWTEEVGGNNEENPQYEQEEEEGGNQTEENEYMEVIQTGGGREIESDIDWDGLDRYTDSETEYQIVNNAQTRDFVELKGPWGCGGI